MRMPIFLCRLLDVGISVVMCSVIKVQCIAAKKEQLAGLVGRTLPTIAHSSSTIGFHTVFYVRIEGVFTHAA